jgi:saccharopine dehydrogenase-like NADP-dependent oxidoreductase
MRKILLFGAGKSATCLIDYLILETGLRGWLLTVVDGDYDLLRSKIAQAAQVTGLAINVENAAERKALVKEASIVISLLPPALHFLVAEDCIEFGKNLLTASYLDEKIKNLVPAIEKKKLLFLCEMGLDPGIDHMSAMKLISRIKSQGGKITSFKSHTGGLVAPESDNNPWHYKISWNPRNVVRAGSTGAIYKEDKELRTKKYEELFADCKELHIPEAGNLAYYPNRDSLAYIPVYQLEEAETFLRTTLRFPVFCKCWKSIVLAGLTDDKKYIRTEGLTYKNWAAPITLHLDEVNRIPFEFLGLFDDRPVPVYAKNSADILQSLLEEKLSMLPVDKDMIVMLHEIEYNLNNIKHAVKSSLIVKGNDSTRTAMAKTVGLPLGIAAMLILENKINMSGLYIPIIPEIYNPVLDKLKKHHIAFSESFS